MENEKRLIDAKCKDCIHHFVCETLKGKIKNYWAETCVAYRHKKTCVQVVRCKDCKYCEMCYPEKQLDKEATQAWLCKKYKRWTKPDDFCSYGERREGE